MTINHYFERIPAKDVYQECHDCGEPADIIYSSDTSESETGYTDDLALCYECVDKRTNTLK